MPKRPATLETVHLALELLRRIPRGKFVSAPELHAQLSETGVSRDLRTIQRLLEMLTTNYDIERDDRTRPYGYRWKERAKGGFGVVVALAERVWRSGLGRQIRP